MMYKRNLLITAMVCYGLLFLLFFLFQALALPSRHSVLVDWFEGWKITPSQARSLVTVIGESIFLMTATGFAWLLGSYSRWKIFGLSLLGALVLLGFKYWLYPFSEFQTSLFSAVIGVFLGQVAVSFYISELEDCLWWDRLIRKAFSRIERRIFPEVQFNLTRSIYVELSDGGEGWRVNLELQRRVKCPEPTLGIPYQDITIFGESWCVIPKDKKYDIHRARWLCTCEDEITEIKGGVALSAELKKIAFAGWDRLQGDLESRLNLFFVLREKLLSEKYNGQVGDAIRRNLELLRATLEKDKILYLVKVIKNEPH